MNTRQKAYTVGLVLLTLTLALTFARTASAYTWSSNCSGQPVGKQWPLGFHPQVMREGCSMPNGGDYQNMYTDAGWNWGQIVSVADYNWVEFPFSCAAPGSNYFIRGNHRNEVGRVDSSLMSGNLGITWTSWGTDQASCSFVESDIWIDSAIPWTNEDMSGYSPPGTKNGRETMMHEFGHLLGLGHEPNGIAIMYPSMPPSIVVGGQLNHTEPWGDDAEGLKRLYSATGSQPIPTRQNVFTAAITTTNNFSGFGGNPQYPIGPADRNRILGVCPGGTTTYHFTIGNNGTVTANGLQASVRMTTFPFNAGIPVSPTLNYNTNFGGFFTTPVQITIPRSTPKGRYWVIFTLDTTNQFAEDNEGDNYVNSAQLLDVIDNAGTISCP